MAERRRRWVPIAIGVAFLCLCLVIGMVVVVTTVFRENVDVTDSSAADATVAFDEVRRRFAGQPALLEIRDGEPHRVNRTGRALSTVALQSMKVLAWDPDDGHLARVTLPFWLLRLKSGPIRLGSYASGLDDADGSSLSVDDLEAHGPGMVLDHTSSRGERVLVWLE